MPIRITRRPKVNRFVSKKTADGRMVKKTRIERRSTSREMGRKDRPKRAMRAKVR